MAINTIKTRDQIEEKYKWKVDKIYRTLEDWETDFSKVKVMAPELKSFEGMLFDGKKLYSYFQLSEEVSRVFEKLYVYAHLRSDEDTTNTTFQALCDRIDSYAAVLRNLQAFFVPEILNLEAGIVERSISEVPELSLYEFKLKEILIQKPHILSKSEEEILASVSDCLNAPSNIFGMLTHADIVFPNIKDEEEKEAQLTEGSYQKYIKSKNRRVRKEAFEGLFKTYAKFKNTLAASYTASLKNFLFEAKARKYSNSLEFSLKPNHIPVEVYYTTIDVTNKNLPLLHRYVELKKKLLNIEELHMYDLYVPVIDTPRDNIPFEAGVKIVSEALMPLGKEYLEVFNDGINAGWIDVLENKGKRGGAYSWGCYDTMPYVLLNYNNQHNDVSTLAHEMGHSLHSYFSRREQPYIYSGYELFCAEVASTTNESLLINYLIGKETDKNKRLFLINQELEQIRGTVFRQVMFAEFEKMTHEYMEAGEALTSESLCKLYGELNEKYYGNSIVIDEEIKMEWSRIPHFYRDFYVYQYATGYAAANSFATKILADEQGAVEKYLGFLKSGGSDYPINLLAKAGVDMTTSKPLEDTFARFKELLELLEKEI